MESNTFDNGNWLVTDNKKLNGLNAKGNITKGLINKLMKLDIEKIGVSWEIQ